MGSETALERVTVPPLCALEPTAFGGELLLQSTPALAVDRVILGTGRAEVADLCPLAEPLTLKLCLLFDASPAAEQLKGALKTFTREEELCAAQRRSTASSLFKKVCAGYPQRSFI